MFCVMIKSVNKRFFYVHIVRTVIGFVIYHGVSIVSCKSKRTGYQICFYFAVYLIVFDM